MKLEQETSEASQGEQLPSGMKATTDRGDETPTRHGNKQLTDNPEQLGVDSSGQQGLRSRSQASPGSEMPSGTSVTKDADGCTQGQPAEFVTPPDGGWGWLVVLSSFMIHVIADGIVYSFGVFLTELVDYFHAGRGEITWVGSLQPAITFTVGPLSSALTNRYGCREVTIAGAIIASAGFVMSVWAPNYYYLYFTSGVLAGVGFGLIYLPAIVCVAQYFEAKRSFATGLAVCGSGFGTFVLAPVCKLLIEAYSWRGAMLLLGGFTLNIVVCGIIFRPLESRAENSSKSIESEGNTEEEVHLLVNGKPGNAAECLGEGGDGKGLTAREGLEIIGSLQELNALPKGSTKLVNGSLPTTPPSNTRGDILSADAKSRDICINNDSFNNQISNNRGLQADADCSLSDSEVHTVPFITITPEGNSSSKHKRSADDISSSKKLAKLSASQCISPKPSNVSGLDIALLARSDGALHQRLLVKTEGGARNKYSSSRQPSKSHLAPLRRKDIFYSGNLHHNIPMYRSQPEQYHMQIATSSRSSSIDHHGMKIVQVTSDQASIASEKQGGLKGVYREMVSTLKDMMSMQLLKNPVFLMFAISNFFTSIGFNMPFIFLPDRAEIAGIDKNRAALLLSVIGIANTVGRMVFGYLSDRSWVNRLMLYNSALTVCGLATALSPSVGGNYAMLVVYAAVFGLFIGVYVSLTSVVLVDLLGLDLLTNSFGLVLLFQGLATFIGPPIAGWLYDWTGSYDISFIAMGSLIALSGAMLFFLPPIQRRYERKTTLAALQHDADLGRHIVHGSKGKVGQETL